MTTSMLQSTPFQSVPGLRLREHRLTVPLDHADPSRGQIEVFAREVAAPDGQGRPYLVYLQGGPGCEAPRPTGIPSGPAWLERALADYRVIMLDQRGTGRSTPFGPDDLHVGGDPAEPLRDPAEVADHLRLLRADGIVADAEVLREQLGVERWSLLGQSFGGFTSLHYLTAHPEHLAEVYFTGGLPPVGRSADEVYSRTYGHMARKSELFYRTYPGSRDAMRRALQACEDGRVVLPNGDVVTPAWFRTLGHLLGGTGGADALAHLLESDVRSPMFRHDLAGLLPFGGRNPLYAVLHESSYADGCRTGWSAERTLPQEFRDDPTLLTGEHLYPWHFEVNSELAPYRDVAQALAEVRWNRLYDADRLRATDVPCAAAVYAYDVYVDRDFSEETAALIPGMRIWLTSEYEHNGLRIGGGRVLDRLIGLARDRAV